MTTATTTPIVPGPLVTERLGRVLTVDLCAAHDHMSVAKDSVLPRSSLVVTTAATRMIELSKAGEKLQSIVIVGTSADPTEHPDLRDATENFRALCDKWFPRAKLYIQTRSVDFSNDDVRAALSIYDRVFVRYEWGTSKGFTALTGAKGPQLASLTKDLHYFDHLILEASFYRGDADNTKDTEVKAWVKRVQEIKPIAVHVLKGQPHNPKGAKLRQAPAGAVAKLMEDLTENQGLPATLYDDEALMA